MRFHTDVEMVGAIEQDEKWGSCLVDGDALYVPEASGVARDGKAFLMASIDRYTLRTINGRVVLMRDDAFHLFEEKGKLYDYGILIKIDKTLPPGSSLRDVEHPSIKVLYDDPTKPWHDPFVDGPNEP